MYSIKTLSHHAAGALVLAALASLMPAQAATVTYAYNGDVQSCPVTGIPPCGVILFPGDSIAGLIMVDSGATDGFAFGDVSAFSILVGEFFSVGSDNSAMVDGKVSLDGAGNVTGGTLTILATALPDAPPTEVILDFDTNTWFAQALVPGVPDPVFIASGSGGLQLAPVPLPGAVVFMAPALLSLVTLRRQSAR